MSIIASIPTNLYVPSEYTESISHWKLKILILSSPDLAEFLSPYASLCATCLDLTLVFLLILALNFNLGAILLITLE